MNEIRFWRAVFSLIVLVLAAFLVVQVWKILIPFVLGLVIAYLVHPLPDRFVAMGLRRDRVVLVLYAFLLLASFLIGLFFFPPLYREAQTVLNDLPRYATLFDGMMDRLNHDLQGVLKIFLGKKAAVFTLPFRADQIIDGILARIPQNIMSFAHIGLWALIIPFVSFFALSEGPKWIDDIFDLTPSDYVESLLGLLAEINATLGAFIRGQVLDATCVGLFTMAGLWLLGFNGALLLGFITGLLNLIPFMAPILGGGLALLFGFFQGMGFSSLIGVVCLFILVRVMDDFVFLPFIVGHSVALHPVVILIAILAGFEVGGFLGLVFAVPATAVLKVVLSAVLSNRRDVKIFQSQKIIS